jgi:hypothetical protein
MRVPVDHDYDSLMASDTPPGEKLPSRQTRTRRTGRHRNPYQLALPPDAPAIVLAIPGAGSPVGAQITAEVESFAKTACPGVPVRAGYLAGRHSPLRAVLTEVQGERRPPGGVVVPMVACPDPRFDAMVEAEIEAAGGQAVRAESLGPHPLVAEALHVRLAEAGLARADRIRMLNIVAAADGVLVITTGGPETVQAAGVVGVLLAARLTVPVMPASLADRPGLESALHQLRQAGVSRPALSPCVVGPEGDARALAALAAETGAECAKPLGGQLAISQLVTTRYGAALAGLRI